MKAPPLFDSVEMSPVGGLHYFIARDILFLLHPYVQEHRAGELLFDGLIFLLHREDTRLKGAQVPDLSFIRAESIPSTWVIRRPFPGAPDLVVEVMSPDDKAELIRIRTSRYLEAGTEEVWVVYPETRELHQFRLADSGETVRIYKGDEPIDVDALFPGLTLRNSEIFQLPPWAEAQLKSE